MRRGMSCEDCGLTEDGMGAVSANDDRLDPWSARGLMGERLWALYCERWQPLRWWPKPNKAERRRA